CGVRPGEAAQRQAAADKRSRDAQAGNLDFSGKRGKQKAQRRVNHKEPYGRNASSPEIAPGKTGKPFYQPQTAPKKVVHDKDNRIGQGLTEREQEHAQK